MDRIHYEFKYGTPRLVSNTYNQAVTTLNNEGSDEFTEQYKSNASKINKLDY